MRTLSIAGIFALIFTLGIPTANAANDASCTPNVTAATTNDSVGILELLKDVSIDTKWVDVPAETKRQLQALADDRLAIYRSNWDGEALSKKQLVLQTSATKNMIIGVDRYYEVAFQSIVPSTFTLGDVKDPVLARVLVRNYLGAFAAQRSTLTYPDATLPNCDWDGQSAFDSVRLPDKQTYEAIKKYNRLIVEDLMKIDDCSLTDLDKELKRYALFSARSNAEGSRGDSYGSDYMQQACDIAELNYDILAGYEGDKGRPKIFEDDEAVLREANALYMNNIGLKWDDVGTRASAFSYCATKQDRIRKDVGDPSVSQVAKGMILMQNWWVERVSSTDAAKCSVYSGQDREQIWDAFSADQQFNNDGLSSMESYQTVLDKYKAEKTNHYHKTAQVALRQVFPDETVLTSAQFAKVVASMNQRGDFGVFTKRITEELDTAQGTTNGPTAQLWETTIAANVEYIGGNYSAGQPVRPNESDQIKSMFEDVKAWVARNYQSYPIKIVPLFDHIALEVDTRNNVFTENSTAKISIGVGTKRSKAEYYSWLLHELRHAVMYAWHTTAPDKSQVRNDEGPALEGSGVAVEELLLLPFLEEKITNKSALALYMLDYGIRDARFAGTTDATLKRYFSTGCVDQSDADTVEYAKSIGISYGLLDKLADTVAQRTHAGTQYLQYIWGGLYMLDQIAYLQAQVDPTARLRVDPYVLFACALNTPRRDQPYVDQLKLCMKG